MVIKELEVEARKFEERAKVLEEVLERRTSSLTSKYEQSLKRGNYLSVLFVVVLLLEFLVLMLFRSKFKIIGVDINKILYVLLVFLAFFLLFLFLGKWKEEEDVMDIKGKIEEYKKVSKFYYKLKDAIEKGDMDGVMRIADEVLEDPMLSKALESSGVGDPKVIAYSLYLYANRDKVDNSEVEEVKGILKGPLRKMFEGESNEN